MKRITLCVLIALALSALLALASCGGAQTTLPESADGPATGTAGATAAPQTTASGAQKTETPAHEHTFGDWTTERAAKCTVDGVETRVCAACGETEKRSVPMLGHTFGDWTTERAAKCTVDGVETRVCATCGETEKRSVPMLGHTFGEPSFTWQGVASAEVRRVCATCSLVEQYDVKVTSEVTEEPTCTEQGTKTYTASATIDGTNYTDAKAENLPALGHDYVNHICSRCGDVYTSDGLSYTLNEAGDAYIVTGIGSCRDKDIAIPNTYNSLQVISISDDAFYKCWYLTSMTIPDSVTEIGDSAFYNCQSLTSVTIPDSVTSIGEEAFYWCPSLTSVTIPDSVTSIGRYAFSGCSSLTSVTIPDSVTSIGDGAFWGCASLTSVTVESNNKTYHSVGNCIIETATKTLVAGCKTSVIPTDGSVISIGYAAFAGCWGLTSVTIPDSVTKIGDEAFCNCTGLTSVTIPDSVTEIGSSAFSGCSSLTSVTIPDSVTEIGDWAFCNCTSLKTVYYRGSSSQWAKISIGGNNDPLKNATIIFNYTGD